MWKTSENQNAFGRTACSLNLCKKTCSYFFKASVLLQSNCLDNSQPKIKEPSKLRDERALTILKGRTTGTIQYKNL